MILIVVEREAQEERLRARTSSSAGLERGSIHEDDVTFSKISNSQKQLKSQFYRAVYGVKPNDKKMTKDRNNISSLKPESNTEVTSDDSISAPELYFEIVGPVFRHIQNISWDLSCGNLAVTMTDTNRVTMLTVRPKSDNIIVEATKAETNSSVRYELSVAGSFQVSEGISPRPLSCRILHLFWWNGSLFVSSPQSLHLAFLVPQHVDQSSFSTKSIKLCTVAVLHQSKFDTSRASSYFGAHPPLKPFGWVECIGISAGNLLTSSGNGSIMPISLTWSPEVAVSIMINSLKCTEVSAVFPWLQVIPASTRSSILSIVQHLLSDGMVSRVFGPHSRNDILNTARDILKSEYSSRPGVRGLIDSFLLGEIQSGSVAMSGVSSELDMSIADSFYIEFCKLAHDLRKSEENDYGGTDPDDLGVLLERMANAFRRDPGISLSTKLAVQMCPVPHGANSASSSVPPSSTQSVNLISSMISCGHYDQINANSLMCDGSTTEATNNVCTALANSELNISKFTVNYS